jgi:hypothetical protein
VSFRADAVDLLNALSAVYVARGNPVRRHQPEQQPRRRRHRGVYGQLTWKAELAGLPATLVTGVRYEQTKSRRSRGAHAEAIVWTADNDFRIDTASTYSPLSGKGKYNNLLPALDFQVDLRDDVVGPLLVQPHHRAAGLRQPVRRPNGGAAEPSDRQRGHPARHQRQPGPGTADLGQLRRLAGVVLQAQQLHHGRLLREAREQLRRHRHGDAEPVRSA